MFIDNKILVGKSNEKELYILPNMANRHGLITGASGSGKTITLKVMAESFSSAGVPVFLADVKGDLAGMCLPGENNEKIQERLLKLGIAETFAFQSFPTIFWDVYGQSGHPIRTTVSSIGSTILSRMLGLTEAQAGVLAIAFKIAKDTNKELVDLKDLRLLLQDVGEKRSEYTTSYGNVSVQSIGGIQRSILMLQEQGGDCFFGEPSIDVKDFLKFDTESGYGNINILHAAELFKQPILYSCFMLWLLTYLSQNMPEVGDLDKPKIVFFFDEAHLLFDDMPKYMLTQVTQVVKLIRSKGIGLYFISQTPNDIPNEIQAQLGNRVQHTLRAYTPAEQKIVKAVASSFRINPEFDTEEAIMALGTGEALVTFLNEKGEPGIVEKVTILPPQSKMGTIEESVRATVINNSRFKGKYDKLIDRKTAFEIIQEEKQVEQHMQQEAEQQMYSNPSANTPSDAPTPTNSSANTTPKGMFSNNTNTYNSTTTTNTNANTTTTTNTTTQTTIPSTDNANNQKTTNSRKSNSGNTGRTTGKTTKKKKSIAEKAFTKTTNSALTTLGRKIGNGLYKMFFK
ncbi:MAG: DUF853 family protein [Clostridia bacterium]|nr:DUF853 family protein [Clostridia bacterium]